ncbi:hypothetical protein H6F90_24200 [Trichocoleus sp. FACHB-591]|uniref:hypothetical protein n=1 Tax=Trichocoleus sp. FACHB-591 TaxID=2692872 RepID=UPI001686B18F|nr:hypothetical protein [Trichocoleus sp. FACHB-591]MBD2098174.1 hypothetical protein [Trichocoleus sp. FACHB-591]
MGMRFKGLVSLLVLATASTVFTSAAMAQEQVTVSDRISTEKLNDAFNRVLYTNSGNFFREQGLLNQTNTILGQGSIVRNSFAENRIARDARLVNILYRDALEQQASDGPLVRTPDLPNPYTTSVLVNPTIYVNRLTSDALPQGGELQFETLPPR